MSVVCHVCRGCAVVILSATHTAAGMQDPDTDYERVSAFMESTGRLVDAGMVNPNATSPPHGNVLNALDSVIHRQSVIARLTVPPELLAGASEPLAPDPDGLCQFAPVALNANSASSDCDLKIAQSNNDWHR